MSSALCRTCALCCDGSLFASVPLDGPPPTAPGVELNLREDGSASSLRLPCGALEGRSCSLYESRPTICRKFECLLVRALDEGEIDRSEAQRTVRTAHQLIAELGPAEPRVSVMQRARREVASGTATP